MDAKTLKHAVTSFAAAIKTKNIVPIQHIVDKDEILEDKVALITGGSGGIGLAIAKSFVESRCKVILAGRNVETLQKTSELIGGGENVRYVQIDVADVSGIPQQVQDAWNLYGHIDILVNSAGVHATKSMTDFFNTDEDDFDRILNTNLKGTYFVTQKIAKLMIDNKVHGHVLNISSSTCAEPAWSPYRLSKLGLEGLTKGLAKVLTPYGIVVNGIAPGSTATSLLGYKEGDSLYSADNNVGRMVLPDEIANFAKLMVSDAGNMVIGDTLYISGGRGTYDIR